MKLQLHLCPVCSHVSFSDALYHSRLLIIRWGIYVGAPANDAADRRCQLNESDTPFCISAGGNHSAAAPQKALQPYHHHLRLHLICKASILHSAAPCIINLNMAGKAPLMAISSNTERPICSTIRTCAATDPGAAAAWEGRGPALLEVSGMRRGSRHSGSHLHQNHLQPCLARGAGWAAGGEGRGGGQQMQGGGGSDGPGTFGGHSCSLQLMHIIVIVGGAMGWRVLWSLNHLYRAPMMNSRADKHPSPPAAGLSGGRCP